MLRHELQHLRREYVKKGKTPLTFDFREASSGLANKDNRYIQYVHYYPGRIFPCIPLYLLSSDDFRHLDGSLLDPFAGSGTVLLESLVNPILKRNSMGVEINPLARLISKVKTTPLDHTGIAHLMHEIQLLYRHAANVKDHIPAFKNRELWFSFKSLKKLARLRFAIENVDASMDHKHFFWVCFSSIIRKVAKADPYIPPPVVLKPEKYKNSPRKYAHLKKCLANAEDPDVLRLFENAVNNNSHKLEALNTFEELKSAAIRAEIIWDDAKHIRKGYLSGPGRIDKTSVEDMPSSSVDLIFTSPPYLTAQKYIRTNKLELFWLGYSDREVSNLEKQSIGTERVSKELGISSLGIRSIDLLVKYALPKSFYRALMVYKYFEDMLKALREMHRLLTRNGYAILVIGDNRVLGKRANTHRLLADAAVRIGFHEIVILKDAIRSRSMMTKRNGTGGLIKDEYVIILKKKG